MISQTSEYVLRALVHLASRGNSEPVLAREIAEKAEIPRNYLSKLLYELRRAGLVESVRGKSGGYTLAVDPGSVRIADILDRFDGPGDYEKCFLRRRSPTWRGEQRLADTPISSRCHRQAVMLRRLPGFRPGRAAAGGQSSCRQEQPSAWR
jgi:Rrf2 family protein